MNKLILLLSGLFLIIILAKCGDSPIAPLVPGITPVTPDAPSLYEHERGFTKIEGTQGLLQGAPFLLADRVSVLPIRFSWPLAGFDIPIHNQGHCGSCWAFSSTENVEWAAKIFLGQDLLLSEQKLVSELFGGCRGGDFAGDYEVKYGMVLASDCPYKANNSGCKNGLPVAVKPVQSVNIGNGNFSPSVAELKEAILEYGPLSVDVAAGGDWDNVGANEVISGHNSGINHMVIIFGWDEKGNWLMRNSWGESWGNKGSALVKFGADRIAADAATILVKPAGDYKQWPGPTK